MVDSNYIALVDLCSMNTGDSPFSRVLSWKKNESGGAKVSTESLAEFHFTGPEELH